MVTTERWKQAQQYEAGYWDRMGEEIADGSQEQFDWYGWRADQLVQRLNRIGYRALTDGSARVIEVGSGPVGVASFFPMSEAVAVDPLADHYASNETLVARRNPAVRYVAAPGEELPAGDGNFDLAIIENCIDHVQDVNAVMRELHRVLRPGGVLYLTVNCRTVWGFAVHRVLSRLGIDAGHPHTFTTGRARRMLADHAFTLKDKSLDQSFFAARWDDLTAPGRRPKMKAILGVSEATITTLAEKI